MISIRPNDSNSNLYGTESVTFVKQRPRQAPMTCQPTAPRRHLIDMGVRMPAFNSVTVGTTTSFHQELPVDAGTSIGHDRSSFPHHGCKNERLDHWTSCYPLGMRNKRRDEGGGRGGTRYAAKLLIYTYCGEKRAKFDIPRAYKNSFFFFFAILISDSFCPLVRV